MLKKKKKKLMKFVGVEKNKFNKKANQNGGRKRAREKEKGESLYSSAS